MALKSTPRKHIAAHIHTTTCRPAYSISIGKSFKDAKANVFKTALQTLDTSGLT